MRDHKLTVILIACLLLSLILLVVNQRLSPKNLHPVHAARFDESLLQGLKLPSGFKISVFAKNLDKPRMLAVHPDGSVFVTRPDMNDVLLLHDHDADGVSDQIEVAASGLDKVHGITIFRNRVYFATVNEVYASELRDHGISNSRLIVEGLPDGGNHFRRTIGFGHDSMMYVSVGSTCNACVEENEEHATMLQFSAEGKNKKIFARGLRNTIGFGWHPETGVMWGMDIGTDWRGNEIPPEELNEISFSGDYGWPFCFGNREVDSDMPDPRSTTKAEYCKKTIGSTLNYDAHCTPIGFLFYTGDQFPAEYQNDAFVALHGSWNRASPCGYKVVRIRFQQGRPVGFEDFVSGFLIENGTKYISRPAGLAQAKDGSLFVSDDGNGVIYRVSYRK